MIDELLAKSITHRKTAWTKQAQVFSFVPNQPVFVCCMRQCTGRSVGKCQEGREMQTRGDSGGAIPPG